MESTASVFVHQPRSDLRPPAVAGSFYPRGSAELAATVKSLLAQAVPSREDGLLGVIVPHAGYVYSGPVAASAFIEVAGAGRVSRGFS